MPQHDQPSRGARFTRTYKRGKAHTVIRPSMTGAEIVALLAAPVRTAPLPAGVPLIDWRVCGCSYAPPVGPNGRPVPHRADPAWAWTEELADAGPELCLHTQVKRRVLDGYGLGWFHSRDSMRDHPGYPDAHIWGPAGPIYRELKKMESKIYLQQWVHLTSMRAAGLDVGIWKPCCLLSGRVDAELAQLAGAAPSGPYARPGALPAVSGVPLVLDPAEQRAPRVPRLRRPAAVATAAAVTPVDLAEVLGGGTVTGYVIDGGRVTAEAATVIGEVRTWLRVHGIPMMAAPFPLRMVVDGQRLHVQVRSTGGGLCWQTVDTIEGFPERAVRAVASRTLTASEVDAVKRALTASARAA